MHTLFEAARAGATDPQISGVDVVVRPALTAGAADVLGADGYLLGTPANLGYISGALKHFFDQIYYPCLTATIGRPYGLYVHGNNDTGGAAEGRRGDHDRAALASGPPPGVDHRRAASGRHRRLLGARRHAQRSVGRGTRLNPRSSGGQSAGAETCQRSTWPSRTTARHTAGPSSAGTLHVERPRTSTTPSSVSCTSSKSLR